MKNFSRVGITPLLIILIVAGILAIGAGGYVAVKKIQVPSQQQPLPTTTAPAEANSPPAMSSESCKDLVGERREACYEQVAVANKDISVCDKVTYDFFRGECYAKVAGVTGDANICYRILSLGTKEACFSNVAIAKNDLSVCELVRASDPFYLIKLGAHDACYGAVAAARKDSSLCVKVTASSRDQCYISVANAAHATSICANVISSSSQAFCIQRATLPNPNASSCDEKTGILKDQCLVAAAIASSSTAPCAKVSNMTFAQGCYVQVAMATKDPSKCDGTIDSNAKDSCYLQLAVGMQDAAVCTKISSSTLQGTCQASATPPSAAKCAALPPLGPNNSIAASSAGCYINLAEYYRDDSYCTSVPAEYGTRGYCYNQVSTYVLDRATCDKIGTSTQDIGSKDQCYLKVGSALGDLGMCLKITDERPYGYRDQCLNKVEANTRSTSTCTTLTGRERDTCYSNVAYAQSSISPCSSIQSSTSTSNCVRQVAVLKNDPSLCANVPAGIVRDSCYESVGWLNANPSSCVNITNKVSHWPTIYPSSEPDCYMLIAQYSRDASVCSNIKDSALHTNCLSAAKNGN